VGWASSVGIATHYGLDGLGTESRWRVRFSTTVLTGLGTHPASYTMCIGYFPGVKRLVESVNGYKLVVMENVNGYNLGVVESVNAYKLW